MCNRVELGDSLKHDHKRSRKMIRLAKHGRSEQELNQAFLDQYQALTVSSASYDQGNLWEAMRLATVVHTLVHDGGSRSRSLIGQLGIRDSIPFVTCMKPPDEPGKQTMAIMGGMCGIEQSAKGPVYYPVLGNALFRRNISFKKWWKERIYTNRREQIITRMNLVFSLRSQDGGSHFDPELPDNAYLGLKTASQTPVIAFPGPFRTWDMSEVIPIRNGHLAVMRQVAFELIETLAPLVQRTVGNCS